MICGCLWALPAPPATSPCTTDLPAPGNYQTSPTPSLDSAPRAISHPDAFIHASPCARITLQRPSACGKARPQPWKLQQMSQPVLSQRCVRAQNNALVHWCTKEAPNCAEEDTLGQETAGGRENSPPRAKPSPPNPSSPTTRIIVLISIC